MTVVHEDGSEEIRTVTIEVTGTPENWTVTQDNGDGVAYVTADSERRPGGDSVTVTGGPAAGEGAEGRRWQHGSETGPGRRTGGVTRAKKRGQGIPCPCFSVPWTDPADNPC